jgi:protein-disulfide isomerase
MSATNKKARAERAAALMAERERRAKRRQTLIVVGIVVGLLAVLAVGFGINRLRDTSDDVDSAVDTAGVYGVTIGPEDAPHEVVVYEDFLCPFCGDLEAATGDELAALAEEGKVRVTYRPFVLLSQIGDYSERSAAAFGVVLDKAGPEVAKEFHDLLFANQPSEEGPFPDDDELVDLAVAAGADEDEVGDAIRDLDGREFAEGATHEAVDAGVRGTPTVLLDGEVFNDGRTMDELAENLVAAVQ